MNAELLERYIDKGFSTREIAAAEDVSQTTVRYWLKKHKLKTTVYRREERLCLWCGESVNNLYCDNSCQANHVRQERIDSWLSGEWDGTRQDGLSATIRNYLLEQADYCCSKCGWSGINPVSGRSTVQVDHKDGNAYNNSPGNLEVLCPNCHSLTPTYGALNKGNSSRTYRYT